MNAVDKYDQTALHIVAMVGCVDILTVLMQNGADVNAGTRNGQDQEYGLYYAVVENMVDP